MLQLLPVDAAVTMVTTHLCLSLPDCQCNKRQKTASNRHIYFSYLEGSGGAAVGVGGPEIGESPVQLPIPKTSEWVGWVWRPLEKGLSLKILN